jgi:hypothetical protein
MDNHGIERVYAIGDSFSFGQGLKGCVPGPSGYYLFNDELRKTVYSGIMADKLGVKNYINMAMPGASNDRTIRKIFNDISAMIAKGIDPKTLFLIIGITHAARKEVFIPKTKLYQQLINNWKPDGSKELNTYWETWVSYFDHEIEHVDRYLETIISMQLFLERLNIRYIMTNSMGESPEFVELMKNYKRPLNSLINKKRYPDIQSFHSFAWEKGFEPTPCHHVNEEAHEAWANHLLEYIDREKLLEPI